MERAISWPPSLRRICYPWGEAVAEIKITVGGDRVDADVESLWDWLRDEPQLRGYVHMGRGKIGEGAMGLPVEIVILAANATVVSALTRTLSTWLIQRKSQVTVEIKEKGGRKTTISASGVANPEELLRKVDEVLGEALLKPGGTSDTPT
jgi:hypothetical protein